MVRVSQNNSAKVVGVLALQGAFSSHIKVLNSIGVSTQEVRTPQDLASVDALVMPGGESTTMSQLLESSELFEPIKKLIHEGLPVFGTCAGMILLASKIIDGRDDQLPFGAIDIEVQRNAYGRQIDSLKPISMSKVLTVRFMLFLFGLRESSKSMGQLRFWPSLATT